MSKLSKEGLIYFSRKINANITNRVNAVKQMVIDLGDKFDLNKRELDAKIDNNSQVLIDHEGRIIINSDNISSLDTKYHTLKSEIDASKCDGHAEGDTINVNNVEQYIFKNIEPDETVKIPNTGDGSDFIVECFVQTDEGDTIKHKVLDFNSNTADLIEYDPRYTVIDDDGIKPRTSVRLKLEKEQLTDDIVMYTSEPIPALLLDSIDNLDNMEFFLWE